MSAKLKDKEKNIDEISYMNMTLEEGKIHYNINIWNGYTKQELKERWVNIYKTIQIEEM